VKDEDVVLLGLCRTAIGRFGGALRSLTAADLGAVVVRESVARAGVAGEAVDDVVLGCVLQAGAGMNVARQAAIRGGLPDAVPAMTVNRVCGSGLQAAAQAAQAIRSGDARVVLAGGTESMSNAPHVLGDLRWGHKLGPSAIVDVMLSEGLTCALEQCHMGVTGENVAARYGISRGDQDAFALESQRRAREAITSGRFRDEIVPIVVPQKKGDAVTVDTDEHPRFDSTLAALSALGPAYQSEGTVTAGNASGINDGAAALVVTSAGHARSLGLEPMARLHAVATSGVAPGIMGMGPVPAVRRVLDRAGVALEDLARIELNEAFAAQALAVMRELTLSADRVNVNGGAIALGHPIGASGARILVSLVHELRSTGGGLGLAALCIGGGMGIAAVVEAV